MIDTMLENCTNCNGYGVWPDDGAAVMKEEKTWQLSDPCNECGADNELYIDSEESVDSYNDTDEDFLKMIKNFEAKCAEL